MPTPNDTSYQSILINDIEQFESIKSDWEKVYNRDPDAMFYVSWTYLNAWFRITKDKWFVIAVKDQKTSEFIGFLPLKKFEKRKLGLRYYSLLTMGTSPMPVYTGFVCQPEKFDEFSARIVSHLIKKEGWDKLFMSNIIDPRIDRFLEAFDKKKYSIVKNKVIPSLKLTLPDSYEKYLTETIGRDTRALMRRKVKRVENNILTKLTKTTKETLQRDADILIKMWKKRWGDSDIANFNHEIVLRLFSDERSWVYILWYEDKPIAVQSFLEDKPKSTIYAHLISYDKEFSKMSPGAVVFIYGIQWAIRNGYKYIDFAQGLDPYKLALKPDQIDIYTVSIAPNNLKTRILRKI